MIEASIAESDAGEPVYQRVFGADAPLDDVQRLVQREWLLTNGLGGYASATIAGICTRRYHGLLIAALPAPLGRVVMLNEVFEELRLPGGEVMSLEGSIRPDGSLDFRGAAILREFLLESGQPCWRYEFQGFVLEKRILLPHLQNTVYVNYRLRSGPGRLRLRIHPSVHFRPHEAPVSSPRPVDYTVSANGRGIEVAGGPAPPLRLRVRDVGAAMVFGGGHTKELVYPAERARGYDWRGALWSPGYFRADLEPGQQATLVASTEPWDTLEAIGTDEAFQSERQRLNHLLAQAGPAARTAPGPQLVLAADQFVIRPATRVGDTVRLQAAGDEVRAVIAGYHWFTDWGRDTMISLEGLTLATGRHAEAGYILRSYRHYVRDGLIPNLFPEGQRDGLYHTADATLWYFHAVDRYLDITGDRQTLQLLFPTLQEIVEHHLRGTHFGIHVDPIDGLLSQGQAGYQLTWMDAKVEDWVVTPRRGKAVEINALWYNALRLMERWSREEGRGDLALYYAQAAQRVADAFNERFWYAAGGYLYDIVDGERGNDPAMRPNQIFAISLPNPVLDPSRWRNVLDRVTDRLLTPMGLRSLAPGEADYKPRYDGDLRARDAAYHQGTVWAWLIGPFIDAWLRVHPGELGAARDFLTGFQSHLGEACVGSISEIFDAEAPYSPRGCVAQAWSVAEALRCWVRTQPTADS